MLCVYGWLLTAEPRPLPHFADSLCLPFDTGCNTLCFVRYAVNQTWRVAEGMGVMREGARIGQ